MTAKLYKIDSIPGDHSADMKRMLGEMLEQVEAGEISSIAIAVVHRDGCTGSSYSPQTNVGTQIDALEWLKHRLLEL